MKKDSLAKSHPNIADQWHLVKNDGPLPDTVTASTSTKKWWLCSHGHEWQTTVRHRVRGNKCPYCSNKKVSLDNCLATNFPTLSEQWNKNKNGSKTPFDVTPGSNKIVWWICQKGHEWKASIVNRKNGTGCPYCSNRLASRDNSLKFLHQNLASEWDLQKNGGLKPSDVVPGSNKVVWWKCANAHSWKAQILERTLGRPCPYCNRQRASKTYSLATIYPTVAEEWDKEKNSELSPTNVLPSSNRRVWWRCKANHLWQAAISDRTRGRGCPYCSNKKAYSDNCLLTVFPDISKEWDYEKNHPFTPENILSKSGKPFWWKCSKGHNWKRRVADRTRGRGCPYCAGRYATPEENLALTNPTLLEEWDYNKNQNMSPETVKAMSGKKVWWKCRAHGHEWNAALYSRSAGRGCPKCRLQTSKLELGVYCELKYIFSRVEHKPKVFGKEIDVFLPDLKVGIEIDGEYWHRDKVETDSEKNRILTSKDITTIRIRSRKLQSISDNDIYFEKEEITVDLIFELLKKIQEVARNPLDEREKSSVMSYLQARMFQNESEYLTLLSQLPGPFQGKSLQKLFPELSKEWHSLKNSPLTPSMITPGSRKKVWWKCSNLHEWQSAVADRSRGNGCPYCSKKRPTILYNFSVSGKHLLPEWNTVLNGNLSPDGLLPTSHRSVWWKCNKGHEWKASIANRMKGRNCPFCGGRKININNCLAAEYPELTKEWHPSKNDLLTPYTVRKVTGKSVWWLCSKNSKHEWKTYIYNRTKGSGCPYCAGQKTLLEDSLTFSDPALAKEWYAEFNLPLKPTEVLPGSGKKVFWICPNKHIWQARIVDRRDGKKCPQCKNC